MPYQYDRNLWLRMVNPQTWEQVTQRKIDDMLKRIANLTPRKDKLEREIQALQNEVFEYQETLRIKGRAQHLWRPDL